MTSQELPREVTDPSGATPVLAAGPVDIPATATLDFSYVGDRALGRRGLRPAHPRVSIVVPAKDEAKNIREIRLS